MTQAAYYSATLTYLNAVKAANSTNTDKVMAELHKMKIDESRTSGAGHNSPRLRETALQGV
jgi:branched-chain amino acid transport system substrate-binding protein